jgi:hypothetical protein
MGLGVMHILVHITNFDITNFHLDVIDSLLGMKIWACIILFYQGLPNTSVYGAGLFKS